MTQSQHQQTAIWHPPSSTFCFGSFNQFVSSALTSSSTRSKVITLHYPSSCSLHTTLTFTELRICHTDLMSGHKGEFITVFGWVICLQVMEIIGKEAGLNYLLAGFAAFLSGWRLRTNLDFPWTEMLDFFQETARLSSCLWRSLSF